MKKCTKCGKIYNDEEFTFCKECGSKLELKKQKTEKIAVSRNVIISVGLIVAIVLCFIIYDTAKTSSTMRNIEQAKNDRVISKMLSEPNITDLEIMPNWSVSYKGDYIYVDGSIKNISKNKTIRYYKITAKYLDASGSVIDSDWTNGSGGLEPGESQKFNIMHRYSYGIRDVRLEIAEAS